jgi:hypothetical protein
MAERGVTAEPGTESFPQQLLAPPLLYYPHQEEAIRMDLSLFGSTYRQQLWLADTKPTERRAAAQRFAQDVENVDGVCEVWLTSTSPDLDVAVVLRDLDLSRELGIRGMFVDVVCAQLSAREGELSVYALSEGVPGWVREGERLSD